MNKFIDWRILSKYVFVAAFALFVASTYGLMVGASNEELFVMQLAGIASSWIAVGWMDWVTKDDD